MSSCTARAGRLSESTRSSGRSGADRAVGERSGRSFGPQIDQDADRPAIARLDIRMVATSSRILSCAVAMLMRKYPRQPRTVGGHRAVRQMLGRGSRDLDSAQTPHGLGPGVAAGGQARRTRRCRTRRLGKPGTLPPGPNRSWNPRHALLRRLFRCVGQCAPSRRAVRLCPTSKEAGAVEAARQAILGPLIGEFLVARTHETCPDHSPPRS